MDNRSPQLTLVAIATALALGGCTAIDLGAVTPPAVALAGACADPAPSPGPHALLAPGAMGAGAPGTDYVAIANVQEFSARITQAQLTLPSNLQRDPVVTAFGAVLLKSALKGQVAGLKTAHFTVQDEAAVDSIAVPKRLTHNQVTHFVKTLLMDKTPVTLDLENQRVAMLGAAPGASIGDYLSAYYNGTYVDFYGTKLAKPSITMTISDQEIAAVLSVFLDYMIDSLKTVPVLTSDGTPTQDVTTFYIGGNKNLPTALALKLATFEQLPADSTKCEWTGKNAQLLGVFANAAGDEAATVSGLVSQSAGGFEIGLGFLGKLSVGDNQTLGTIVKTAASRAANRAALATLYWAVESRHRAGA